MSRLSVSMFAVGVCLLLVVGVKGQTRKPGGARSVDEASGASRSVEPDSPAAKSTVAAGTQAIVPRLMKFSGALRDASGKPLGGAVDVTFALYSSEAGGSPLWFETQSVQADELGRYTALLGAMHTEGLPMDLFTSGEVRWLGIQVGVEAEQQPRVLLVSVPYALKAGDAETLDGKPASAFMLSESQNASTSSSTALSAAGTATAAGRGKNQTTKSRTANTSPLTACTSVTSGGMATANHLSKFTTACNIEPSGIVESNGNLGIGTTTPLRRLTLVDNVNKVQFELQSSSASTGPNLFLNNIGTTNGGKFIRSFNGNLQVLNSGYTAVLLNIRDGGNVGIGTTGPPAAKLEVNGTAKFDGLVTFAAAQNFSTTTGTVVATSGTFSGAITSKGLAVTPDVTDTSGGPAYIGTNILAGYSTNTITSGTSGATIAGGGGVDNSGTPLPNKVTDDFGTVAGGAGNQAGDDAGNTSDKQYATVGGGQYNTASGLKSTVAGGAVNTASGGGATVAGGASNAANGTLSTVAGGEFNVAGGLLSFAAGCSAHAAHAGAFVWADSSCGDFSSTATDQFLIKAAGGVGIGTNAPTHALDVAGDINATGGVTAASFTGNGSGLTNLNASNLSTGTVPDARLNGIYSNALSLISDNNNFTGNGGGLTNLNAANLANGLSVQPIVTESGSGITYVSANVKAGYPGATGGNAITAGVTGATIAGGGGTRNGSTLLNKVTDNFGTVGGGSHNQAGNGLGNFYDNSNATVAGGDSNVASGQYSTVAGGGTNTASGFGATVPGGASNSASGVTSFAAGCGADAATNGSFVWSDSGCGGLQATAANEFLARASGGFVFTTNAAMSTGATLAGGSGSWGSFSDRNAKANFAAVDGGVLLTKLNAIPMSSWNYKTQAASIRHLGPMAQDFYAAFGLGEDDKHITTVDEGGVALAGVQALYRLSLEKDAQIGKLSAQNQKLSAEVERLKKVEAEVKALRGVQAAMTTLEARLARLERQEKTTRTATAHSSAKSSKHAHTEMARVRY